MKNQSSASFIQIGDEKVSGKVFSLSQNPCSDAGEKLLHKVIPIKSALRTGFSTFSTIWGLFCKRYLIALLVRAYEQIRTVVSSIAFLTVGNHVNIILGLM